MKRLFGSYWSTTLSLSSIRCGRLSRLIRVSFFPHVIVAGLSVHATEDLRQEMITAGATSVLTKDHAGARLHEEITKAVDYRSAMLL